MPSLFRRRRILTAGAVLAAVWLRPARAAPVTATQAVLVEVRDRETRIHANYVAWGRKAAAEGYLGIAYLFAALAAAEAIHAQNASRLLRALGHTAPAATPPPPRIGTTKENLLAAVESEIADIDENYPAALARIRAEGAAEAEKVATWAWHSERQHRDLIQRIRTWSPGMFEAVARTIDAKTGRYFVCGNCGAVQNRLPDPACAVCREPPSSYRPVEPPAPAS